MATVNLNTTLTHTWYLSGRRLHAALRQPAVVVGGLFQPAIWLFLFGSLFQKVIEVPGFSVGGSYLDFLVPGIMVMNAMGQNMFAGMGAIDEIDRGTLNRFLVSPASRVALMNANVVELGATTTFQSVMILLLGLLGGARYPGGPGGGVVAVVAAVLVGIVFGALSNAAGMLLQQREAIIGIYIIFMLPLTFLSSAFIPPVLMPAWIRTVSAYNPVNWAVVAGRSVLGASTAWGAVAVRCGGLLALAVVCVTASVVTFRAYQKNA
jgi:ABC-2 type transport system permease protein